MGDAEGVLSTGTLAEAVQGPKHKVILDHEAKAKAEVKSSFLKARRATLATSPPYATCCWETPSEPWRWVAESSRLFFERGSESACLQQVLISSNRLPEACQLFRCQAAFEHFCIAFARQRFSPGHTVQVNYLELLVPERSWNALSSSRVNSPSANALQ